jgi:D-alanyl-lipoteichoic acid acyltransferase DltB (MBOAT superfamily)
MNFLSWNFALFTLIALAVYYLLPRRGQNIWLLACSLFFYASFGWKPLAILAVSVWFNYLAGIRISRGEHRRAWLNLGIGLNLASLVLLRLATSRYAGVILSPFNVPLLDSGALLQQIYLPVGFSFYMMQAIGYLVDVYHKKLPACTDPVDFSLYMAYFPKIVSGPIEKAKPFLAALAGERVVDGAGFRNSLGLLVLGLTRKVVFADLLYRLAAGEVFVYPATGAINPWLGLLAYAFYIYNDFAGYTDIVRGISGLFGIQLSRNFQNPYLSRNFSEFWTRWHITLSNWLKEYIFFPLSRKLLRRLRNPEHVVNLVVPVTVTMLASGLWHGLSPAMLFWGGLHALYLVFERVQLMVFPSLRPQDQPPWLQKLSILGTLLAVAFAWVFFGMNLFKESFKFWLGLFSPQQAAGSLSGAILAAVIILLTVLIDTAQEKTRDELFPLRWPAWAKTALAFAILNMFFLAAVYSGFPKLQEFVYRMF